MTRTIPYAGFAFCVGLLATASVCDASLLFTVTLDTSPLIGHPAGPFSLEFQLNDGSATGDGNNVAVLNSFQFGSGGMAGPGGPTLIGGTTGNLSSAVGLQDSAFLNEFFQPFIPGTLLCFNVSLTTNLDNSPTPDQFSFAILDGSGVEIPTTGLGDALLKVDINSANPPIQTFATALARTDIALDAPSLNACVPEPTTCGLLVMGFGVLTTFRATKALVKRGSPFRGTPRNHRASGLL